MTADQRVTLAREYLASVRHHDVASLPPSVLVRECAELRRQLGQVLDVIDATAGQLPSLLAALADAATFRTERAAQYCYRCSSHPAGACDEHLDDLDAAKVYRDMITELQGGQG